MCCLTNPCERVWSSEQNTQGIALKVGKVVHPKCSWVLFILHLGKYYLSFYWLKWSHHKVRGSHLGENFIFSYWLKWYRYHHKVYGSHYKVTSYLPKNVLHGRIRATLFQLNVVLRKRCLDHLNRWFARSTAERGGTGGEQGVCFAYLYPPAGSCTVIVNVVFSLSLSLRVSFPCEFSLSCCGVLVHGTGIDC